MVSISNTFIHPWSIVSNICFRGSGCRVMSVSNAKVNTFTLVPHTLLCVSSIMSVAINNPDAGAKSNVECFSNVDFSLINLGSMVEKHTYYYKGMYHIYSTTISMFLWVSDRWLFWSCFLAPHHSPPTLIKTSAITEINVQIHVSSYVPSKLANPWNH